MEIAKLAKPSMLFPGGNAHASVKRRQSPESVKMIDRMKNSLWEFLANLLVTEFIKEKARNEISRKEISK